MKIAQKSKFIEQKSFGGPKIDIIDLFCSTCLKIPEYSISINEKGILSLCHICEKEKNKIVELSANISLSKNSYERKCNYCSNTTINMCLKCGYFICEECKNSHERYDLIKSSYFQLKKTVFPIVESQYICREHIEYKTNFCNCCRKDLCKICCNEHIHHTIEPLKVETKIKPLEYKGNNATLNLLSNLAELFFKCYKDKKLENKLTINSLLNYYLIEPINSYIKNSQKNKEILNTQSIANIFQKPQLEKSAVCKGFGSDDFNYIYFTLITNSLTGNIMSYHKLLEIQNYYNKLGLEGKKMIYYKQNYIIALNLERRSLLQNFALSSKLKEVRNYPFILMELKQKFQKYEVLYEKLEYEFELLKKYFISIGHRLDYELRRKISNLITVDLYELYEDKIDKIKENEYLLGLSIEDIEKKIKIVNSKFKNKKEKENKLKNLKAKLENGLKKMKDLTSKKIEDIEKLEVEQNKNLIIQFVNKTSKIEDVNEAIILNLFMIIKKNLNDKMNKLIHNKTKQLSLTVKNELDKSEKEIIKDKSNIAKAKDENTKEEEKSLNKIEPENKPKEKEQDKIEKNENTIKEQNPEKENKFYNDKICPNRQIALIKQKIKTEINISNQDNIFFEEMYEKNKKINILSLLSKFHDELKNLEKETFDVNSTINFDKAIDLYLRGKKNKILVPVNSDFEQQNKEKEDEIYLEPILKESDNNQSVREITNYLNEISKLIDENLEMIRSFQDESISFIEDNGALFKIDDVLKECQIESPIIQNNCFITNC